MLAHHVARLQRCKHAVVVATTTNPSDDPVAHAAEELGVEVFRGSEDDVLSRFAGAAKANNLDAVVRVTSDCPLIDGFLVQKGIEDFLMAAEPALYLSNTLERSFPRGFDFEVMSTDRLLAADASASSRHQREHVTPWLYESRDSEIRQIVREEDASSLRVTLDTKDDFAVIRALIEQHHATELSGEEIISVLRSRPELVALNAHIEQKKLGD